MILLNLKAYLQQYNIKNELEYSEIIFHMLHNGFFSINRTIQLDNDYEYLGLPVEMSQGVHVMYGMCCCRHATEYLYDILSLLNFRPSLMFIWVDKATGVWRKVNPAIEKANHQTILLSDQNKYILDPANNFILQIQEDGKLEALDSKYFGKIKYYQEDNISTIGRTLKKYYSYKDLGIENVYS